jgi:2,4-dienoyl-CoA reductase-like NADH-dependent reductase (Old Yellow Enzyme family)
LRFDHLFSPLTIRSVEIRNRIFSTGHQVNMLTDGLPGARMAAYHEARAAGGAGLIVIEAARMHDSGLSDAVLDASTDACIPGYRTIAEAVHRHGAMLFGQLSHPGRVNARVRDGVRDVPYSASAVRDDRFKNVPRPLTLAQIEELIAAYGASAARFRAAGLDGVEVLASHGNLIAQFLNPRVNRRTDRYGGSLEGRLRFLREALEAVRAAAGEELAVGIRISIDEKEIDGLEPEETIEACRQLDPLPTIDYFNITAGSMAGAGGSVHVVPPMTIETAYLAPTAALLKAAVAKPVFVAGRINQPQMAERILAAGQADLCGMTRALIADPEMPNKAQAGRLDDIRACIACNQACIGHLHAGTAISCIQYPETGREERYGRLDPAARPRRVLVAGGGPAGMKLAAVAAARGHQVTLCEATPRLGGQVRVAQLIPGRAEFGGLITNLERELELAGVAVRKATPVTRALVEAERPDAVVIATGAGPHQPEAERVEDAQLTDAWRVLRDEANVGTRVVVSDWRGDWIGVGVAEKLARAGCQVRLAVNGPLAGHMLQLYLRDQWNGVLHGLGVAVTPYLRFYGADADSAYFQHSVSGAPVVFEEVDTVVIAHGQESDTALEAELAGTAAEVHLIGDCLSPRTAEEAVYEGLVLGARL